MTSESAHHVLVVGGGITGLAASYRASQAGARVTLVEAGPRLGGKLLTAQVDGFVVDAGPESLAPGKPHAAKLAAELGIALAPAAVGAPGAVLVKGQLRTMPDGLGGFIPRKVRPLATTRLFSPAGKARMAVESLLPARKGDADESLRSFTSRRLGRQAYQRLVEPVATGIFCGDPARLSLLATMPHLRAAEQQHGGLLRAVLAERKAAARKPAGPPRPGLSAPAQGMGALSAALVERLERTPGVDLRVSTRVTQLEQVDGGYRATLSDGTLLGVTGVVLAVPTAPAAEVLESVGASAPAATLRAMPVDSVATVSLGYLAEALPHLDGLLPAHGYLLSEPGRGRVLSVTRSSAKYAGRAPAGHELFRVSVRTQDGIADEELVGQARAELRRTLRIEAAPVVQHVRQWTQVMPQYEVGHLQRVAEIEAQLATFPGIRLAGSGTHGLGLADCVASAERAVTAICG
ncbi:protoporphyrinogen oxidase [Jatrophihabitans telluris]|uniref:Coproporphyrinogen III oxidase n=1 Tax=Jatrophihabitans telluris TaxID=2038343 RepID=A0ABY4QW89_9ACTN|nr:protoporphyrinogen oxidase [Jatrophihabitans telluris]UQX87397.1 protoporphyrinogen oxidase [Jatrophihabitans telluris]